MSALSQTLRWLKLPRTSPSCTLIVQPNPRTTRGFRNLNTNQESFDIKLEGNFNLSRYSFYNPISVFAMNGSSNHYPKTTRNQRETGSQWVSIIDSGAKNADGKTLAEVLIDIMDKFPKYDLNSEEGITETIRDIETSLDPIASFEAVETGSTTLSGLDTPP